MAALNVQFINFVNRKLNIVNLKEKIQIQMKSMKCQYEQLIVTTLLTRPLQIMRIYF